MKDDIVKIEVNRNGEYAHVEPKELTNSELCEKLSYIQLDSDEFVSDSEIEEGYAVIGEAMRRLEDSGNG